MAIACCAGGLIASPVAAQSSVASKTLPVTGSAPQVCTIQNPRLQSGSLVNVGGIDGNTVRILQFTDPQTLAARAASATVSFDAVCNFPHQLRIESENNGLWPTDGRISATASGFAYAVPYEASVSWDGTNSKLYTDGKVRRIAQQVTNIDEPAAGDLRVSLEIAEGASNVDVNAPLLAGAYADTLRIFLEPR
ncbi:hypothetical protein [Novosphingobium malaysiense]|nr:hypothetical protein [Novosphingobium malaysiense]